MNSEVHTIIFFFYPRADSLELSTKTSKYTPHCSYIKHSATTHQFLGINWLADPVDVKRAQFSCHRSTDGNSWYRQGEGNVALCNRAACSLDQHQMPARPARPGRWDGLHWGCFGKPAA